MGSSEIDNVDDPESIAREAREIWENNAAWWDSTIGGEGNAFHRNLVEPATDRLLDVQPGELVLEIACGNGAYARHLLDLGARVVATDVSRRFLEIARQRTGEREGIEFLHLDATDEAALLALGEGRFDAAVITMALMDIPEIEPLMRSLALLLKPDGRVVFSVCHPCFNTTGTTMVVETGACADPTQEFYGVKVSRYLRLRAEKGVGIVGQPQLHYYFDRPLSVLFAACFNAGFVLDGLEEPADTRESNGGWKSKVTSEIPQVMVARLRLK